MIATSKYSIFIPKGNGSSLRVANALYTELLNFGVEMSSGLFDALNSQPEEDARKIAKNIAKQFSIGNVNEPLFKNWESRHSFSFDEICVQILGYSYQFCGNDFDSEEYVTNLKRKVDIKGVKTLKLSSIEELKTYASKILSSSVSQDKKTADKIARLFKYVPVELISDFIKSDEVRISALISLKEKVGLAKALETLKCKPADALRYSAALKDWNFVKLPADAKFKSLPWAERKALAEFLNGFDFDYLAEGMGTNRAMWKSFLAHNHIFGQKEFLSKYSNFCKTAFVSVGGKVESAPQLIRVDLKKLVFDGSVEVTPSGAYAYRTFASRMAKAIENKDFDTIQNLSNRRSGYVLRNISTVLNGVEKSREKDFVNLVRNQLQFADVGVMFSLLGINVNATHRIIDVKGDTRVEKANYSGVIGDIQGDIRRELRSRFGVNGKIEVDEELRNQVVPFLSKNADLPRGTRIKVDKDSVYFFMHWVQDQKRTDLDHSYLAFDAEWNADVVAFYNQANGYLTHGGDITNAPAPKGATEYGKIRIDKIPKTTKYIAPIINVFCGDVFSKLKEARAGFWSSDSPTFKLSDDAVYYDLTQPAEMNIPFVLDVKNSEIIVVDFNARDRYGAIAANYGKVIKEVIEACSSAKYVTIGELADILSRGDKEVLRISNNDGFSSSIATTKPEELFSLFQ
jgi:hypothetical protein